MKRGKPFEIGNKFGKGRPLGSRNKINDAARKLLDEHGVALIGRCIAAAHRGDMKALHILIDRLLPRRLPTPRLKLSSGFETSQHIGKAYNEIMHAIANGNFPSAEGQVLAGLLKAKLDLIALKSFEARLLELEQKKAA